MQDNTSFREQLLIDWHKQFAENQRIREQSFLKILGFLGAVVFGYAYVFEKFPDRIIYAGIVAIMAIFFGAWQVINIAYNYRRDQYVNYKIRELAGLVGENKIFPTNFNPIHEKKGAYGWIPDFLKPYYYASLSFQMLIFLSYAIEFVSCDLFEINWWIAIVISLTVVTSTIVFPIVYFYKLINKGYVEGQCIFF